MSINMFIVLFGGLGLFIYGMNMMSEGLKTIAGNRMKRLLEVLTNNRLMGVLVGTIVTMLVQSSSTTTVMVVGFVNAGIMSLIQATGVIMGANIGTTITAQMIAFNISQVAPISIAIGTVMFLFSKKKRNKQLGAIILGFGILFTGIDLMSGAMEPLRDHVGFRNLLISFSRNPILGVLAGFALTAVIQSSSASIGLLQALAISGAFNDVPGLSFFSLTVPILLGENIGTCVTAMISSLSASITAKRAAIIHLTIKIIGTIWALLVLGLINLAFGGNNPVYNFIIDISGTTLVGGELVPNLSRQIANTHTIFNVLNTLVQLPFAAFLVSLSKKILPGEEKEDLGGLKFLDNRIMENPTIAVGQAVKETVRMARFSLENVNTAMKAFFDKDEELIGMVLDKEKGINSLEREITGYLIKLSNSNLLERDHIKTTNLYHTTNDVERIGDHAENLAELAQVTIDNRLFFSDTAISELKDMAFRVTSVLKDSITSLENDDIELAKTIYSREQEIDRLEESLRDSHIERLNKQLCNPSSGVIFLDIVSNLERIADHATNISKTVLDLEKTHG